MRYNTMGMAACAVLVIVGLALAGAPALAGSGWVEGKVTREGSGFGTYAAPVIGATVTVAGTNLTDTTDAGGWFNISLPEGNYTLTVAMAGYDSKTTPVFAVVSGNATLQNLQIRPQLGNLSGIVADENGSPLAMATVMAGGRTAQTGQNGAYSLVLIQAGTVTVTVTPLFGAPVNFTATVVKDQNSTKDFQVTRPSLLTVTVIDDATGKPVSGATVRFGDLTGTTDQYGRATLAGAGPGKDRLYVSADDYQYKSIEVSIPKGGTNVTVRLVKKTGSSGSFLPGPGVLPVLLVLALAALAARRMRRDLGALDHPMQ
jgi:hypothetical protein